MSTFFGTPKFTVQISRGVLWTIKKTSAAGGFEFQREFNVEGLSNYYE
jgi:hypothetical protein